MRFHAFNIGKPHIDAWWARNRQLGIITAGFSGQPGDRGDVLLHQMDEGDWVLAYSNGHGFIGAGRVGPVSTYRLMAVNELPPGWEATHRHFRQVDWVHAVASLVEAIPAEAAGRQAPRQTKELLPADAGTRLIQLLAKRSHTGVTRDTLPEFSRAFAAKVEQSSRDTPDARRERLQHAPKHPERMAVLAYEFVRNPDVVAEVLYQAKGKCGRCKSPAPFVRRSDGSPYLEVHHKTPLSARGEDTVENAIALCANCHRELHYGASAS
jgi:5-methylcytosine-specific restriction endonuclease McrA